MNQSQNLSTADLVRSAKTPPPDGDMTEEARHDGDEHHDELVALFAPEVAQDFQSRWSNVQLGFVDDPKRAVQQADELVAQVMTSLAETFSRERSELENLMSGSSEGGSTENMRVALQRYRSFFQRLLTL